MKNNLLQKVQKILCYAFLIASAGVLISSFVYIPKAWTQFKIEGNDYSTAQSFYTSLRTMGRLATGARQDNWSLVFATEDDARWFYYNFWGNIQSVNNLLFSLGIAGVALTAITGICGNFSRKKYYISNLVSGIAAGAVGIIISIITIIKGFILMSDFNNINPDCLKFYEYCESPDVRSSYDVITSSNCWISIIVPIVYIVVCGIFIAFTVIKYLQTNKKEAAL